VLSVIGTVLLAFIGPFNEKRETGIDAGPSYATTTSATAQAKLIHDNHSE